MVAVNVYSERFLCVPINVLIGEQTAACAAGHQEANNNNDHNQQQQNTKNLIHQREWLTL